MFGPDDVSVVGPTGVLLFDFICPGIHYSVVCTVEALSLLYPDFVCAWR